MLTAPACITVSRPGLVTTKFGLPPARTQSHALPYDSPLREATPNAPAMSIRLGSSSSWAATGAIESAPATASAAIGRNARVSL